MNNIFLPAQTSATPVILTAVQQPHSAMPIMVSSPSTSIALQNLSPSTIVRAVFMPPDQQHRPQQPQHFVDNKIPPYVYSTPQFQTIDSTLSGCSAQLPIQNNPAVPSGGNVQQRNKGQAKQQQGQPKTSKKSPKRQSQQQQSAQKGTGLQQHPQQGVRLTKKQQEKEDYYCRKYQLLRKCIRSLVFKNAALCDEVARLHQRIATVDVERKTVLKRLLHHERLKARRIQTAELKKAQQQAAEALASASTADAPAKAYITDAVLL